MTTITHVGWYLFSTNTDKYWNDLKINWGLENCTVYQYIYELSGVPIANETQLGNNNWSPINVGNNNNPSLTKYKAYWVRVTDVSVEPVPVLVTTFTYSDETTSTSNDTNITTDSYNIPNNESLVGVTFGQNVTGIQFYTFNIVVNDGLSIELNSENVIIPASVTNIGNGAFANSGITSVLYNVNKTRLVYYPSSLEALSFTIPNSVTTIGYSAFSGVKNLTSITIPEGVTTIETAAFAYMSNLTSINIPNTITSIGQNAFQISGLTQATMFNTSLGKPGFPPLGTTSGSTATFGGKPDVTISTIDNS